MPAQGSWADQHPVVMYWCKGLAIPVVLALAGWLTPKSIRDAAFAWLVDHWSWPRGVLLVFTLATAAWPIFGAWLFVRRHINRPPPYEAYRIDEFLDLRWRWKWLREQAIDPRPFCPSCDLQLDGTVLQHGGQMPFPTGELLYQCRCGKTSVKIRGPNAQDIARTAALHAEREARKRGLIPD